MIIGLVQVVPRAKAAATDMSQDTKEIQEQTNVSSLKQLYPTILIKSKTYDANSITFAGPRIYISKLADNLKLAEFATYSTNNLHIELR